MILNGENGSRKGHVIDLEKRETVPTFFYGPNYNDARRELEATQMNERYAIVEHCKICKEPLIAEEVLAHKMNHIDGTIRHWVRTIMALNAETREAVLAVVKELS